MKKIISDLVYKTFLELYELEIDGFENIIEIPPGMEMGDFSLPCFEFAKHLKKNPKLITEDIKERLLINDVNGFFDKLQCVNGYLNIFVNRVFYINSVLGSAYLKSYGASEIGKGKNICMDYSSPNIAKNFHVGHLRTTVIGNSLYKIYSKLGYNVIRINHLGDWGTQFGKLIVAYKNWSSEKLVEEKGIEELLRVYVKFDSEAEKEPNLNDEARLWFSKMENGDQEALKIWKWFKDISLSEFERVYEMLNVEFDSYNGESFYVDKIPDVVEELKKKKLLTESEGASIINLEEYDMPPCLITKRDGSSIYHSRDIAAALYRKKTYNFEQCIYVTGVEQKLHFAQVFKVLELMGYTWAKNMHHVPYGLVSMGGEKLSTRKGNIIYAEDILKEAILRAEEMIEKKKSNIVNKEETAKIIGIGAVIYHDLFNLIIRDVKFNWNEVLNFDGITAPYIQYTFARANSILRRVELVELHDVDTKCLQDDLSYQLIKIIDIYPEIIKEAADKYEPSILARYVYNLAVAFNKFYQGCRIVDSEKTYKNARSLLTLITKNIIEDAMGLLGIACPEEM